MNEKKIIKGEARLPVIIPLLLVVIGVVLIIIGATIGWWAGDLGIVLWCSGGAVCILLAVVLVISVHNCRITVTDKRIFGTAAFGKRVDLPLDSVSAVGTSWLKGISVATSSGKIAFRAIPNRDEIHEVLSNLLIKRQGENVVAATINQANPKSNADEIKKYKELLDMGVITQEEFDEKKKQLLGL